MLATLPGTACSHALNKVVAPVAVRLEVQAEVQERLTQRSIYVIAAVLSVL